MAARIPDINVIQDTPTSPNHVPRPIYTSPELPRVPEDGLAAPEVDRDAEGLQVDPNGPYPQPTTREMNTRSKHWFGYGGSTLGEKQLLHDDSGLIPYDSSISRGDRRICGFKRRTFIILASVLAIALVCAAIGGGVGGYYANKSSPPPTPTSEPGDNEPTVTSGTTGMAARPCTPASVSPASAPQATPRAISNPYLAHGGAGTKNGATFDITCRRGVPVTGDQDGNRVTNIGRFVTYNFTACMDHCAETAGCHGVVYGANLTEMVADGDPGANCLLKNGTWEPVERRETWMASALKRE